MLLLQAQFLIANMLDGARRRVDDERGAIPIEYVGILIFTTAVVVGIITSGMGQNIIDRFTAVINDVLNAS